jgi:hypothetical protein
MTGLLKSRSSKIALRVAALIGMTAGLSGCYTDFGLGYASDGYGYNNYDCDPYSPFDSYYNCDYGYGFSNVGYGGGWYDNFYYPGYGLFLFDNYGRRFNMRDDYRRYWAGRRNEWQRNRYHGNNHNGNYGGGNYGGGTGNAWPHRDNDHEGRGHDDHHRDGDDRDGDHRDGDHRDGDRDRDGIRGRWQPAVRGATGSPVVVQPGREGGYGRGKGRPRDGSFDGRGSQGVFAPAAPVIERDVDGPRPERRGGRGEWRGGQNIPQGSYTPPVVRQESPAVAREPAPPERRTARPEGGRRNPRIEPNRVED